MPVVFDFSFGRPDLDALKAAGAVGVVRYLAYDNTATHGKILRADELDALHAAGLPVALNWETTATRALEGDDAGRADALEANRQATNLGFPNDRPIFYSVDTDTSADAVRAYFAGAVAAGGRPVGVYGSYRVVEGLTLAWKWQCTAWSHGQHAPDAVLFQEVGTFVPGTDRNQVLAADWGGWHPDQPTGDDEMTQEQLQRLLDAIEDDKQAVVKQVLASQQDVKTNTEHAVSVAVSTLAEEINALAPGGQLNADAIVDKIAKRLES